MNSTWNLLFSNETAGKCLIKILVLANVSFIAISNVTGFLRSEFEQTVINDTPDQTNVFI